MMGKIKLSIIIPVFNVEKYIYRCINSIYSQSFDDNFFEVIVVDDGTCDESIRIVEDFFSIHKNLIIIRQKNQGLSVARNRGLEQAKGEYVWFVDSDDWLCSGCLRKIVFLLNGEINVISSYLNYSYDNKTLNHQERCLECNRMVNSSDYLANYPVGAVQRYIIKRQHVIDANLLFIKNIYHEDMDFGARLIVSTEKILVMAEPIYNYYQRQEGSIKSNWNIKNTNDMLFVAIHLWNLSDEIHEKRKRDNFKCFALRTMMDAFPLKKINVDIEIKKIYNHYKRLIRRKAALTSFLFIPLRQKLYCILIVISPIFYLKVKNR